MPGAAASMDEAAIMGIDSMLLAAPTAELCGDAARPLAMNVPPIFGRPCTNAPPCCAGAVDVACTKPALLVAAMVSATLKHVARVVNASARRLRGYSIMRMRVASCSCSGQDEVAHGGDWVGAGMTVRALQAMRCRERGRLHVRASGPPSVRAEECAWRRRSGGTQNNVLPTAAHSFHPPRRTNAGRTGIQTVDE
ncbi:hypothetical protein EON62_02360 [archaeon]|nr:MAG: hypothetical protein EON62_02360 [archaeon]